MTFLRITLGVVSVLLLIATTAYADGFCGCSSWRFTADGLALQREHMDDLPLVVDPASGAILLDADDLSLNYRGGLRLAAARDVGYRSDLEFEFFFVDQLSASTTVAAPGAQLLMYGATFGTDPISVGYSTDLYSFEANWRRAWGTGCVKTLIGFRMMELGENMRVIDGVSPPQLFVGDIDNHLYGFQLGIEAAILRRGRWEIEGGLKCGIYGNSADFDARHFPRPVLPRYSTPPRVVHTTPRLSVTPRLPVNCGWA